jgi:hypothetical protein
LIKHHKHLAGTVSQGLREDYRTVRADFTFCR